MISAADVLSVLTLLREAGADVVIAGGWGIDALTGEETRAHGDLDLLHREEQEPAVVAALTAVGWAQTLDRRPVRFVLSHPSGSDLDLHPLRFAPDGSAVQSSPDPREPFHYPAECFVTGTIGGTPVRCLSARQQIDFHQGYEPRPQDLHDMAQLRRAFGVTTHF
ncbi:nucleotidyltransferase domain-containing protein [Streptomyces sp. NBC_01104]|uniref:nucleotidyltransferase domain-containing protein n=1 Tax=Streptomyces sp. NBC_01104 TaxID=2903750 RepID=UPI003869F651|nr:amino acid transporter [Streptomyces sp. NBC_01104]